MIPRRKRTREFAHSRVAWGLISEVYADIVRFSGSTSSSISSTISRLTPSSGSQRTVSRPRSNPRNGATPSSPRLYPRSCRRRRRATRTLTTVRARRPHPSGFSGDLGHPFQESFRLAGQRLLRFLRTAHELRGLPRNLEVWRHRPILDKGCMYRQLFCRHSNVICPPKW